MIDTFFLFRFRFSFSPSRSGAMHYVNRQYTAAYKQSVVLRESAVPRPASTESVQSLYYGGVTQAQSASSAHFVAPCNCLLFLINFLV